MQADLLRQIRKARQSTVKVGKFTFTILRPTDVQATELHARGSKHVDLAREFVTGWDGVTEADVVPQGTTDVLEFDPELWSAWLDDRPDFWVPIGDAVLEAYSKHAAKREASAKN